MKPSRLVSNVVVDGEWWGPAYGNAEHVPSFVAARITNPAAWDGGRAPTPVPSYREAVQADMAREAAAAQPPASGATRNLDPDGKGTHNLRTPGGEPEPVALSKAELRFLLDGNGVPWAARDTKATLEGKARRAGLL